MRDDALVVIFDSGQMDLVLGIASDTGGTKRIRNERAHEILAACDAIQMQGYPVLTVYGHPIDEFRTWLMQQDLAAAFNGAGMGDRVELTIQLPLHNGSKPAPLRDQDKLRARAVRDLKALGFDVLEIWGHPAQTFEEHFRQILEDEASGA